ncbi:MAG: hypothetical protein R3C52_04770 [Hyphomonadaceae bacterium]
MARAEFEKGLPIGVAVGIALGAALGVALGNMAFFGCGLALGMGLAPVFGKALAGKNNDGTGDGASSDD